MKKIIAAFVILHAVLIAYGAPKQTAAVVDFSARGGVSQDEAATISDIFRVQLVKVGAFTVIDRANMETTLREQSFQMSGCTEAACAVQVGKMLNVKTMFYGNVSKLGSQYYVIMNAVDVESSKINKTAQGKMDSFSQVDSVLVKMTKELAGDAPAVSGTPTAPVYTESDYVYFPIDIALWGNVGIGGLVSAASGGKRLTTSLSVSPFVTECARLYGITIAGFGTFVKDDMFGLQASYIINMGGNGTALQLAPINVFQNGAAIQIGGLNFAGSIYGLQSAPTLNYAKRVRGAQIGLINYTDELGGIQLGLVNIALKGAVLPFFPIFNIGFSF